VVFKSLSQNDIKKILALQLADLQKRLDEQDLKLRVMPSARTLLMEKGYDMKQGARPMRRAIQDLLEDPLATGLLDGKFTTGDTVTVTRRGDSLNLAGEHTPTAAPEIEEVETEPVTPE
jgi:ATP-dependent Clp protease ATP-binding subunit ClpA